MAEKRMFSKKVIDTDWFMDMPATTQNLYFHLSMRADDDGFVANPKQIIKLVNGSEDDFKLLVVKKFIIPFESGVCVISDWRINNYLRADRYKETIYKEEMNSLLVDENGKYSVGIPSGIPLVDQDKYTYSNSISKSTSNSLVELKEKVVKKEKEKERERNLEKESEIFEYWNSKNIVQHQKMSEPILVAIQKALKQYDMETIKTCIDRYDMALKDKDYFFSYVWGLKEFLTQKNGLPTFLDDGEKWLNYGKRKVEAQETNTFDILKKMLYEEQAKNGN